MRLTIVEVVAKVYKRGPKDNAQDLALPVCGCAATGRMAWQAEA